MFVVAKAVILVVWAFSFMALFTPGDSFVLVAAQGIFALMVVTHLGEVFFFRERIERAPGSRAGHLVQTALFGMFHLYSLGDAGATAED